MNTSHLRVFTKPSTENLPFMPSAPRNCTSNLHFRFDTEDENSQSSTETSSRTIRRTLAFDEWDDATAAEPQDESMEDEDDDLYHQLDRIIQRTLAFDEWDDHINEETTRGKPRVTSSRRSFLPITTISPQKASVSSIPHTTQLDLDAPPTATAVTPSPAPKHPSRLERPLPLYLHQRVDPSPFWMQADSISPRKDYQSLENMLSLSQCESILRRASAFRNVGASASEPSPPPFEIPHPNTTPSNDAADAPADSTREEHWFDKYGSGTTLFEEDDIFESPSSTSEEFSTSSNVPRFIMFTNNE